MRVQQHLSQYYQVIPVLVLFHFLGISSPRPQTCVTALRPTSSPRSSSMPVSASTPPPMPAVQLTLQETAKTPTSDSPPTVLLHGLDSASHTWKGVLDGLEAAGYQAVALDQRGCGRSPLGDPEKFSPEALVEDIYTCLSSHPYFTDGDGNIRPFVLVGHSMGGRVAMSFAARYPESVVALVIEDMDIRRRSIEESHVQSRDRAKTLAFDRSLASQNIRTPEAILAAFADEGYPSSQVQKWLTDGRIEDVGTAHCYSHVHPAFRLLCYEHVFETNHGEETWKQLAAMRDTNEHFPIHLQIADPSMTVCDESSISAMQNIFEEAQKESLSPSSSRLTIRRYEGATHSIHNSQGEEFLIDLKTIVETAKQEHNDI
mmetsp:Transcript_16083/g.44491  ORF Transcript_16083/g.44491 Transcript_16083/m.44491 type:complete len:373 (+) Transcript_16083:124-1242(+)|eukprot:CAMPEP_0172371410 /NCGR_PEP_ID=MMETSP1060-20121228/42750_1 /TAXON_ID=37318 /ORGANISM="Pseudo-nitzschia pungens, Strain cf. cingulata" /LENGTH=372 /DNA_ID=CAMNT_0013097025 /DNA_START=44 /DNA_END=1162 /DNA_ORIENTATION=+